MPALRLGGWRGVALAILTGAYLGLGQVPFSLVWLAVPALVCALALFLTTTDPRTAFWRGWAVGVGYAALTMFWIVEPFLVDLARHGWMAPFALLFMAAGFGVFWGAGFAVARWAMPTGANSPLPLVIAWSAVEMLRSYALTGFPWGLLAYTWIETPVYQVASVLGPHGLNLATLALGALVILIWRSRHRIGGTLALVAASAAVFVGAGWIQNQPVASDTARPVVRLIQPNAPQDQKWDPAMMPVFYARQIALSAEPANPAPDLVVWPEVAVPFLLDDPGAPFWEISGAAGDVPVIIGAQRLDGAQAYNSVAVLGEGGEITARYDKHHLVPIGEYLPLAGLMNRIGLQPLTAQYGFGYTAGPGPRVLDLGDLGRVLPMICYEAIFPHELRRVSQRPDWLLLLTNDAWFGALAGPYQHLAQARARSIELGLPMVRVANTGVSAMIDARGRITGALPLGVSGRIDLALPPPLLPTVYARAGDWPAFLVIALGLAVLLTRKYRLTRH